jgi:hypothetical protein
MIDNESMKLFRTWVCRSGLLTYFDILAASSDYVRWICARTLPADSAVRHIEEGALA